MRLRRGVHGEPGQERRVLADTCVASGDDRHERCRRATGGEQAATPVRHPEPLPEPVDDGELDLVRSGSDRPDASEEVIATREPITHQRRKRRDAWDIAEEARVRLARVVRQHALGELAECGIEADALLGRAGRDGANEPLRFRTREGRAYRLIAQ